MVLNHGRVWYLFSVETFIMGLNHGYKKHSIVLNQGCMKNYGT